MSLDTAAFAHVPQLQECIRDPEASRFRNLDLTEMDRKAREAGFPEGWRRPDAEREAIRRQTLEGWEGHDVWIFAYGSLMWDPAFYFAEARVARAPGYERRFCLKMTIGRGSPSAPGLMAALDIGEACEGLVFRIASHNVEKETEIIFRREMISFGYAPTFIPIETDDGPIEALTFVADHACERYARDIDREESARMIAQADGINGTNIEYLENLAAQLETLGLDDPAVVDLHARTRRYV